MPYSICTQAPERWSVDDSSADVAVVAEGIACQGTGKARATCYYTT